MHVTTWFIKIRLQIIIFCEGKIIKFAMIKKILYIRIKKFFQEFFETITSDY